MTIRLTFEFATVDEAVTFLQRNDPRVSNPPVTVEAPPLTPEQDATFTTAQRRRRQRSHPLLLSARVGRPSHPRPQGRHGRVYV